MLRFQLLLLLPSFSLSLAHSTCLHVCVFVPYNTCIWAQLPIEPMHEYQFCNIVVISAAKPQQHLSVGVVFDWAVLLYTRCSVLFCYVVLCCVAVLVFCFHLSLTIPNALSQCFAHRFLYCLVIWLIWWTLAVF